MKNTNKLVGILLILLGILGIVCRTILIGYHNVWDFVMLDVFIVIVIIGISCFKGK